MEEAIKSWVEEHRGAVGVALVGVILVGGGVFWWRSKSGSEEIEIVQTEVNEADTAGVVVDVGGAVGRPGVYKLILGARVEEAIATAGGVTDEADVEWIQKYLNRSEKIRDGMKIYIPTKDSKTPKLQGPSQERSSKININTASQLELESLPGVGR